MDLEAIKKMKAQCESEISVILNMFEEQSGCNVVGIRTWYSEGIDPRSHYVVVKIDVSVDWDR